MAKQVGVYIRPGTEKELLVRGNNRSGIINRDLERLYTLYGRAILEVPLKFEEACLIVDTLNGALLDAATAHLLWANVEDSIKLEGLADKWNVDGPALVEKLRGLSAFHCMALIDATERFWSIPDNERNLENDVRQCFSISSEGD